MREYRQNAHVVSLSFWAMICLATAIFLFWHSGKILKRMPKTAEVAGGVALLMFGPVALTAYLLRANLVWVAVDPARGLLVRGRHLIPWEAIEKVTRRRPRLRKTTGPAQMPGSATDLGLSGCAEPGCATGSGEGALAGLAILLLFAALLLAAWLVVFVFIPLVLIPALEVFAPLGDRFTIEAAGRKLVLRDLRHGDQFAHDLSQRVRVDAA
jgi:hypothetical protein